jgi:hypothetical protein
MEAEAVRDQVGVKASRRRRAASSPAHGRHVACVASVAGRAWPKAGVRAWVGRLSELGRKRGGGPVNPRRLFLLYFQFLEFLNQSNLNFKEEKKAFSRFDPKIKVVQNLILYNFALGHILKFQTDFELRFQSPFFK